MMLRALGTLGAFLSAVLFPWPLTALVTLGVALFEPLVPLSVGLFIDILYHSSQVEPLPFFTVWGALATVMAFFVRSRLKTGIIGE